MPSFVLTLPVKVSDSARLQAKPRNENDIANVFSVAWICEQIFTLEMKAQMAGHVY